MENCEELVSAFHQEAVDQIHLAVLAAATPVAEMHIELAMFSERQSQIVDELCEDD